MANLETLKTQEIYPQTVVHNLVLGDEPCVHLLFVHAVLNDLLASLHF